MPTMTNAAARGRLEGDSAYRPISWAATRLRAPPSGQQERKHHEKIYAALYAEGAQAARYECHGRLRRQGQDQGPQA